MSSVAEHLGADERVLTREEFARIAGLRESQVRELVDYQLLAPGALDLRTAFAVRDANRIGKDFDLDLFTVGLLAAYLLRIGNLEAEVERLRAERPVRSVHTEVSFTSVEWHSGG